MKKIRRELELEMDTSELEKQTLALRLCFTEMGLALDTLLVTLREIREARLNAANNP